MYLEDIHIFTGTLPEEKKILRCLVPYVADLVHPENLLEHLRNIGGMKDELPLLNSVLQRDISRTEKILIMLRVVYDKDITTLGLVKNLLMDCLPNDIIKRSKTKCPGKLIIVLYISAIGIQCAYSSSV